MAVQYAPGREPSDTTWTGLPALEVLAERSEWYGDCLIYFGRGDRTALRYRTIVMRVGDKPSTRGVHVVSFELHHGPLVPPLHMVRHTCDRPPCINPHHLLAGDGLSNVQDRGERGRRRNGATGPLPPERLNW